ncbi:MAG: rod shape-determining protein RodA [Bacteroidaceae bacterium]|nr:rod shape-determining protein RodA [Bacteroidaceae bacterium]
MEQTRGNILGKIDWWTVLLFLGLAVMGWLAVCGASYSFVETDYSEFLNPDVRTGKQAMWIGVSIIAGMLLMCFKKHTYINLSWIIYIGAMLIGLLTILIAEDTKGSYSWIKLGSLKIQPAEFMKFATALMLAAFMGRREFNIGNKSDLIKCIGMILLPMAIIIGQRETGSALVYLAFFLVLYREGMTGLFLLMGVSAVIYFVVGIKFGQENFETLPVAIGPYAVTILIQIFSAAMVKFWCKHDKTFLTMLAVNASVTLLTYWTAIYLISFDIMIVQYLLLAFNIVYLLIRIRLGKETKNLWVALYIVGAVAFYHSCNYVMYNVLKPHQQVRIEVLLGLKEDLNGAGYNVHQSKIAIGSGGLTGKGFLNGTQTKLDYVPEQDTDFIFCTIGEEQGFIGSAFVLTVFIIFILRLIALAERQSDRAGRVFGYSLASIFFFHFAINIGMVLGITPVIGIPLPFFSYGGSSFLGFSILLFVFLRIDADRERKKIPA